jgi:hypothetical protein
VGLSRLLAAVFTDPTVQVLPLVAVAKQLLSKLFKVLAL